MRRSAILAAALVAAAAAGAVLAVAGRDGGTPPPVQAPDEPPSPAALAVASPATRTPLADALPDAGEPLVDFDVALERLVDLALRGMDEAARGDSDAAQATDAEARALLARVVRDVPDHDARALFTLTGLGTATDRRTETCRGVLGHFLWSGLQRHEAASRGGDRRRLDAFLAAMLGAMLPHEPAARLIAALLADRPFLGVAQEQAVLGLAEQVITYPWLLEPVRRLLLTLWANLERSGARARDQLEILALMLKDDANPARRAAALDRLLASGDPDLVDFVVHDVEARRDAARARDLAGVAAARLPGSEALAVLRRLRPLVSDALVGPALDLARRAPAEVRATYEELRATDGEKALRADLVTGLGFHPSSENLAAVQAALASDPDVEVRERALLALTANAAAALGARAVETALADAELCGARGERLGVIVAALDNLARAGEVDAAARLGRGLLARKDLPPAVRADLERLLAHGPERPPMLRPR